MQSSRRAIRTSSFPLRNKDVRRSSRPPVTKTATSFCAVAAASRTTTRVGAARRGCAGSGAGLTPKLMVDMSHANSSKQYRQQLNVCADIGRQLGSGEPRIMGVMIESNLVEGRQDIGAGRALTYGQSVTDACIGWDDSLACLEQLANAVAQAERRCAPPRTKTIRTSRGVETRRSGRHHEIVPVQSADDVRPPTNRDAPPFGEHRGMMIFRIGERADAVRELERPCEVRESEHAARAVRCRRASRRCQSGTCRSSIGAAFGSITRCAAA